MVSRSPTRPELKLNVMQPTTETADVAGDSWRGPLDEYIESHEKAAKDARKT